ncbi:MAG TPA: UDP-N-acetylmuramate dehydrogenase [Bacteroidales bacterium]|nr:UDP-N-acetylmuramate dehydrogenase [Bacteroidales bacterium]
MEILSNYPLQSLNTFGFKVDAKYFAPVASLAEVGKALDFAQQKQVPVMVLGGGSNVMFTKDFEGLILKYDNDSIEVISETEDYIYVKAGAGLNWDQLVAYCVERGWGGLENLSLIPGNVGASPIQNIGAYGVEMKDHFESLEYLHFETNETSIFFASDCQFGYRDSIFKNALKGKGLILNVTFRLNKKPVFNTSYGTILQELEAMNVKKPDLQTLRQAVINIRRSKLPDPAEIGNAGSFFKNPEVSTSQHQELKERFPNLVSFALDNDSFKLAAGWLIDQCGWKGYREGDAGVHARQALVLVNYGKANGKQLFELSEKVLQSVKEKFGVELEREVNVV